MTLERIIYKACALVLEAVDFPHSIDGDVIEQLQSYWYNEREGPTPVLVQSGLLLHNPR